MASLKYSRLIIDTFPLECVRYGMGKWISVKLSCDEAIPTLPSMKRVISWKRFTCRKPRQKNLTPFHLIREMTFKTGLMDFDQPNVIGCVTNSNDSIIEVSGCCQFQFRCGRDSLEWKMLSHSVTWCVFSLF